MGLESVSMNIFFSKKVCLGTFADTQYYAFLLYSWKRESFILRESRIDDGHLYRHDTFFKIKDTWNHAHSQEYLTNTFDPT